MANKAFKAPVTRTLREKPMPRKSATHWSLCLYPVEPVVGQVRWWYQAQAKLVAEATSFGSVRTTAERRARWVNDPCPPGFIRLSAGCEDPADLLADLSQTLDAVSRV